MPRESIVVLGEQAPPNRSATSADWMPEWLSLPERITWHLHNFDYENRRWRHTIFVQIPPLFADALAKNYIDIWNRHGCRAANSALLDVKKAAEELPHIPLALVRYDDELIRLAKLYADRCKRFRAVGRSEERVLLDVLWVAGRIGVPPPEIGQRISVRGVIARLCEEHWWRHALRCIYGRHLERLAIQSGVVHRKAGLYASNETVARRAEQKARNRALLSEMVAVNELGQEYTLQALADLSVSNPAIRRAELMVRIAGFEEVANLRGDVAEFYTVTCPSRMHARIADSGIENRKYDGTDPRQAQQYLAHLWQSIRAKLHRLNIKLYGFRIAEPQHDGTPHWHLLLFMAPDETNIVREVLHEYALREDGDEPGAQKHRFRADAIDYRRGTATGYVAKYVAKNIDGYGLGADSHGNDPASAAKRVDAWASLWGIRQYQQIGGPPVGVWRELRRLSEEGFTGLLRDAIRAADAGDWATFTELMGGPSGNRAAHPIRIFTVWSDKPGKYDEPIGNRVYGVQHDAVRASSRIHEWEIRRRDQK